MMIRLAILLTAIILVLAAIDAITTIHSARQYGEPRIHSAEEIK